MARPLTYVLMCLIYARVAYGDEVDCVGDLLDDDLHYLPLFTPQAIRVRLNCECKGSGACNDLKKGYMIQVTQFGATNPKTASYTKKKFNVGDTIDQPIFAEYTENVFEHESSVSIVDKNSDVKVGPGKKYKIGYRI
uniref:Uncharacterized protein n=1 Tax=Romanomermis culicivorax TaxID=13658 RepID=A0A915JRS8_ROMCU